MRHSTRSRANEATDGRPLRKKAKTEPDQHDPEAEGGEPQQEIAKKDDAKTAQAPTWGVPQPEWDALLRKHSLTRVSMDFYDLYALAAHLSPESPLGVNRSRCLWLSGAGCWSDNLVIRCVCGHGRHPLMWTV